MIYRVGQNVQYFIWNENGVFNFTTAKYSLHLFSEIRNVDLKPYAVLNILIHGSLSVSSDTGAANFKKQSSFLAHPVSVDMHRNSSVSTQS